MFSLLNSLQGKKAVAYYRHSAEDKQENSVLIQREHAQKFAIKHNIEIIHEEADEGVSGLIANRPGFKRLFNDWVYNLQAPHIDYVLFYDISRWGRFQDQNEGAHYAFMCKKHGKILVNVSRGFPQEGQQLTTSLIDSIDRFMAAEYSRVLSEKVWYGAMKVSRDGYSAGGTAPYGMARLLLDENKNPIGVLKKGQHKLISNQRVTFTPLNDQTTETIREIFNLLVNDWHSPNGIAEILNEKGILSANGGKWNRGKIVRILTNEAYAGTKIYNKTWGRLKQGKKHNPRADWAIAPDAFPATISKDIFYKAQEHLYWLMPSKWKKGVYKISKAKQVVFNEIKQLLSKRIGSEENTDLLLKNFPIVFSVTFYKSSLPLWCFAIPDKFRQHDSILAISIVLDKRDLLDQLFILPTEKFSRNNFLLLEESDDSLNNYKIDKAEIQKKLSVIIDQFLIESEEKVVS
ncbi:MAG: recombinase family protein [Patescibacteria group bacterium]